MNVFSIQSWVSYGHVGNAAAILPLQRLGHEVWAIHTVQFSNHPGYGGFRGRTTDPGQIAELVAGLDERGALAKCDAVLSGYLGSSDNARAVAEAVLRVRAANPAMRYCCDPVLGDEGRVFVAPDIPDAMRERLVPLAEIVTPNRFELELLTGKPTDALDDAVAAARALIARGPKLVAVTGLVPPAVADGEIGALAVSVDAAWLVATPRLALDPMPNGAGDAFAALFLGRTLMGAASPEALSLAISAMFALFEQAAREGTRELPLVALQDRLVAPNRIFPARIVQRGM